MFYTPYGGMAAVSPFASGPGGMMNPNPPPIQPNPNATGMMASGVRPQSRMFGPTSTAMGNSPYPEGRPQGNPDNPSYMNPNSPGSSGPGGPLQYDRAREAVLNGQYNNTAGQARGMSGSQGYNSAHANTFGRYPTSPGANGATFLGAQDEGNPGMDAFHNKNGFSGVSPGQDYGSPLQTNSQDQRNRLGAALGNGGNAALAGYMMG